MSKKLIFVDNIEFIKDNSCRIAEIIRNEKALVLPLSDLVFLYMKNKGFNCIDFHDFEYKGLYENVYSVAREWGTGWYKPRNKDFSEVDSVSLGTMIDWFMIYFFTHFLRMHLFLGEVIKNLKPNEIIFITAKEVDYMEAPLKLRNVDCNLLQHMVKSIAGTLNLHLSTKLIKLTSQEKSQKRKFNFIRPVFYYFNVVLSRLFSLCNFILRKNRKIIFYEGFRHFFPVMASSLLRNLEIIHLEKVIGLSLMQKLYSRGIRIDVLNKKNSLNKIKKPCFDLIKIKAELSGYFIYKGQDFLDSVWPRIEYLFRFFLPDYVYPDLINITKYMRASNASCLIVENDSTYDEKMLVIVAKKFGVYTVVIQNGATWIGEAFKSREISIHDFYPLIADKFLAYGELNKSWYKNMNVDPEKIVVTGAARFDEYYKTRNSFKILKRKSNAVLVLLNDVTDQDVVVSEYDVTAKMFYKHINEFIKIAKNSPDVKFIIRPHHNEGFWRSIFEEEMQGLNNLEISRKDTLVRILPLVNIVVGYYSTALLEALIFRKIVVSLDTGEFLNPFKLWDYDLSKRVENFTELEAQIKIYLFDEPEQRLFIKKIDDNLRLFNFNDDGKAAERIAGYLGKTLINNYA
ncbi:MAG: hypothetical protein HY761_08480 [Candidatus Omnitrophica bacterium]|nr:hypothetical protein [Candidatus Omnitrophota bacterium]